MKIENMKRPYILLLVGICFVLIGIIVSYYGVRYENAVQGTHEKGMYNLIEYVKKTCLIISMFSFGIFVWLKILSNKNEKSIKT